MIRNKCDRHGELREKEMKFRLSKTEADVPVAYSGAQDGSIDIRSGDIVRIYFEIPASLIVNKRSCHLLIATKVELLNR